MRAGYAHQQGIKQGRARSRETSKEDRRSGGTRLRDLSAGAKVGKIVCLGADLLQIAVRFCQERRRGSRAGVLLHSRESREGVCRFVEAVQNFAEQMLSADGVD